MKSHTHGPRWRTGTSWGSRETHSHPAPPATSTVFEVDGGYFTLAMNVRLTYKKRPFLLEDMCDSTLFGKSAFTFQEIERHKRRVEMEKTEIKKYGSKMLGGSEVRQLILTDQELHTCGAQEEFTVQAVQERGSVGVRVHVC